MTAFLDTNVAVYAHDHGSGDKQATAATLIAARADDLVVSSQVLAEFYWVTTRRLNPPLPHPAAREAAAQLGALPTVSSDATLVLSAIDLAATADLAMWDAMIVVAARRAGCDEILTEDLSHGQVIDGIRIVNPFV